MALFTKYNYTPRKIDAYDSVWNSKTKQFIPVKSMDEIDVHMILDGISIAIEMGVVDTHAWPQQFFACRTAFDDFIGSLSEYDECYRITDQWWQALATLADVNDEEGFVSSSDIAEELFRNAAEEGLLKNWGKKKPTYKHSEKQVEEAWFALIKHQNSGYSEALFSNDERHKMNNIVSFGKRHYFFQLSPALVKKAQIEGKSFAEKLNNIKPPKKTIVKIKKGE